MQGLDLVQLAPCLHYSQELFLVVICLLSYLIRVCGKGKYLGEVTIYMQVADTRSTVI